MVTPGGVLADVGTDHGHVPIFLVERGIVPRAVAMDLREGPLARAKENIAACGLAERIETRLSDGVSALRQGEADSIVIAGMGGGLVVHILSQGSSVCRAAKELILQPQSDLEKVRRYLRENSYIIRKEDMVFEEGKYYPMMRALPEGCGAEDRSAAKAREHLGNDICDRYGACLISSGHPVLTRYLSRERGQLIKLQARLQAQPEAEGISRRLAEVQRSLDGNERAQEYMGSLTI